MTYQCSGCDETFESSLRRTRHEVDAHPVVIDYPFRCEDCGKGLLTQKYYQNHHRVCPMNTDEDIPS